jgi:Fe-S cluster assembly protein SufD
MSGGGLKTMMSLAEWTDQAAEHADGEPAWAADRRRRAAAVAEALPFPDRSLELWRRTDFGSLRLDTLDPFAAAQALTGPEGLPARVGKRVAEVEAGAAHIVQRNGSVVLERVDAALAARGLVVCSMDRAVRDHGDQLSDRLHTLIEPDLDKYAALHQAMRRGGAFVHVPDGMEVENPIRLYQWLDGAGVATSPANVIVLGRNARATIIEELLSDTADGISFHNGGTEVFVGEDARLVYASLQDWGRNVYHYSNQRVDVRRNGELQWIQTLLGARMEKTNSYFRMVEPGAQVYVHGFMFGDQRQHFDMHTLQKHLAEHCTSDLLIKGCLKDRARSVYQGLIQVAEGAQRTDAYQANRNLLLSETARADSIPGLEILANDVRCTHGATIGTVDPEQMYYLMARGLRSPEAQRLIVEGFFTPVIDRIPLDSVRDQLREAIQKKIG